MFQFLRRKDKTSEPEEEAPVYGRQLTLDFLQEGASVCTGLSRYINGKTLLLMSEESCNLSEVETGVLSAAWKKNTGAFPCRVVTCDEDGVVLEYLGKEAHAFFLPFIVKHRTCSDCSGTDDLEQCPTCKGINTVCVSCLTREGRCRDCRSDELVYASKSAQKTTRKKQKQTRIQNNVTIDMKKLKKDLKRKLL